MQSCRLNVSMQAWSEYNPRQTIVLQVGIQRDYLYWYRPFYLQERRMIQSECSKRFKLKKEAKTRLCSCDLQNVDGITANPMQLDIEDWWTLTSVGSVTSRDVHFLYFENFDSLIPLGYMYVGLLSVARKSIDKRPIGAVNCSPD